MNEKRIQEITKAFQGKKVVVVGDFFLDRYAYAEYSGVSRETGNKIIRINKHYYVPGGTSNVAANLASYGGDVRTLGVIGQDDYARMLIQILDTYGIDSRGLIQSPERLTGSYEKVKVYEGDRYLDEFRIDVDNLNPMLPEALQQLTDGIRQAVAEADLVVAPDYNEEGFPTIAGEVLSLLSELAGASDKLFVCTSRTRIEKFRSFVCVPNEYETAVAVTGEDFDIFKEFSLDEVHTFGKKLATQSNAPAFVTCGPRGMTAVDPEGNLFDVPTIALTENIDITGCGDSALCAISMALAAGATIQEAAQMGNMGANVTIRKLNINGTSSPSELLENYQSVFRDSGLW